MDRVTTVSIGREMVNTPFSICEEQESESTNSVHYIHELGIIIIYTITGSFLMKY